MRLMFFPSPLDARQGPDAATDVSPRLYHVPSSEHVVPQAPGQAYQARTLSSPLT